MATLSEITLFPIKSCAGISLTEATLTRSGLMTEQVYDREWVVVDENGMFLTQREHPRMALIVPRLKGETMELRAPGMLQLEIVLDLPDPELAPTLEVQVWDDRVLAYDCDATTAAWFSNFLGTPCRLARFHAKGERLTSGKWTAGTRHPTMFADGYPLLVAGAASLDDLNGRLRAAGRDPIPMNRFRPNLVVAGMEAYEEDYVDTFQLGPIVLQPVKPCSRCPIPSVDQEKGEFGPDPLDMMAGYRAKDVVDGALCFGMNSVVLEGEGERLRVGQEIEVTLAF